MKQNPCLGDKSARVKLSAQARRLAEFLLHGLGLHGSCSGAVVLRDPPIVVADKEFQLSLCSKHYAQAAEQ